MEADTSGFVNKMNAAKGTLDEVDRLSTGVSARQVQAVSMGLMAVGGLFTGAGAVLTGVSDRIEASQVSLQQEIQNTGHSWNDYKGQIDAAIKKGEDFGHGAADTQTALGKLVTATQDPTKALRDLNAAEEVAAFLGIPVADAAKQITLAEQGKGRLYAQLGISLPKVIDYTKEAAKADKEHALAVEELNKKEQKLSDLRAIDATMHKALTLPQQFALRDAVNAVADAQGRVVTSASAQAAAHAGAATQANRIDVAMNQLTTRLHGVAEAQSETFGGRFEAIKARLTDFAGTVGSRVGPALVVLGPILMGLGGALQVFTMVEWGAVLATDSLLWPILAVIAAIALIVGAFILAYTHIQPFHDAVDALATLLKNALGAAITWLGQTWNEIWPTISNALNVAWNIIKPILNFLVDVAIVQIRIAILLLQVIWNAAWAAIHGAIAFYGPPIMAIFNLIKAALGPIGDALGWLKNNAWDPLWNGIVRTVQGVWNIIRPIFDAITGAIGGVMNAVGRVSGIGGIFGNLTSNLPNIFGRAGGGDIAAGQAYMVGENGPELFMSGQSGTIIPNRALGGGIGAVTININGANKDPRQIAVEVRDELLRMKRTTGSLGLA